MTSGILIGYIFQFCTGKKTKFDFNCQTTFAAVLLMNKAFQTNLLTVSCLSFHQSETKNQNKKCVFLLLSQFQKRTDIMASSLFKL